jgi:hypothetical protein
MHKNIIVVKKIDNFLPKNDKKISKILIITLAPGLLVHLCLFHIYINAIGITTYEYVRAHRVAIERSAREASEPTMSTTGAAATNPSVQTARAADGADNDGWNTTDAGKKRQKSMLGEAQPWNALINPPPPPASTMLD